MDHFIQKSCKMRLMIQKSTLSKCNIPHLSKAWHWETALPSRQLDASIKQLEGSAFLYGVEQRMVQQIEGPT